MAEIYNPVGSVGVVHGVRVLLIAAGVVGVIVFPLVERNRWRGYRQVWQTRTRRTRLRLLLFSEGIAVFTICLGLSLLMPLGNTQIALFVAGFVVLLLAGVAYPPAGDLRAMQREMKAARDLSEQESQPHSEGN